MQGPLSPPDFLLIGLIGILAAGCAAAEFFCGWSLFHDRAAWRRAAVTLAVIGAWLAGLAFAARAGWLIHSSGFPPATLRLMGLSFILAFVVGVTPIGETPAERLPLSWLVGFQSFRLPLELLLWQFALAGRIPEAMTFYGANYDIATGAAALFLFWIADKGPFAARIIALWNLCGLALLANVLRIAVLYLPGMSHSRAYDVALRNTLPLHWPGVWILFCVQLALIGHILVIRKIGLFGSRSHSQADAQKF